MRKKGPPSEIGRLAAPLARVFDGAWQRMHWWIATMAVLYAFSGITVVRPDEVAVILRWGSLVGDTPALQQHGPGMLFAFPRPMDRVVRVQVKHVWEVQVSTLAATDDYPTPGTLDPLKQGYAVTGDHNIVHVNVVARYRIREPAEWSFYGPKSEDILRVEVTTAMVRSLGEMGVDRVLSDGRKDLIALATKRAQQGLDAAHSGLELSSVELIGLAPPAELATDFDEVQSAYIAAETSKKEANAYAQTVVVQAQTYATQELERAQADTEAELSAARGDARAFLALDKEYRANPVVVRERLYRDAIDTAIGAAGKVRWIPPPVGGTYHGLRISIASEATPGVNVGVGLGDDEDEVWTPPTPPPPPPKP